MKTAEELPISYRLEDHLNEEAFLVGFFSSAGRVLRPISGYIEDRAPREGEPHEAIIVYRGEPNKEGW